MILINLYLSTEKKSCAPEEDKPRGHQHVVLSQELCVKGENFHRYQEADPSQRPHLEQTFMTHGLHPVTLLFPLTFPCGTTNTFFYSLMYSFSTYLLSMKCVQSTGPCTNAIGMASPMPAPSAPYGSQQPAHAQTPTHTRKKHTDCLQVSTKKFHRNHLKSEDKVEAIYVEVVIRLAACFSLD